MYLAFRYHHIRPGEFYSMGYGEKKVIRAFLNYQIEKMNEEISKLGGE